MMTSFPRATVTRSGLEKTITAAVQQTSFDCHGFIGVYVEHTPHDELGANWRIKGLKYGRAPRRSCDVALDEIVRNLRARYSLEAPRFVPQEAVKADCGTTPLGNVSPLAAAIKRQRDQRV